MIHHSYDMHNQVVNHNQAVTLERHLETKRPVMVAATTGLVMIGHTPERPGNVPFHTTSRTSGSAKRA